MAQKGDGGYNFLGFVGSNVTKLVTAVTYVVEKPFAPNDDDSKRSLALFQILVLLDTISD